MGFYTGRRDDAQNLTPSVAEDAMAYGFATHLWLLGDVKPEELRGWIRAASPDACEDDVVALRLGNRTLLRAINVADSERRWRSIRLVNAVRSEVRGVEWLAIDLQPDADAWTIESSSGEVLSWEPGDDDEPPPGLVERGRSAVRSVVPLELEERHHYVDWAQQLEAIPEGQPAPVLHEPARPIALGLPARPAPRRSKVVATAARSGMQRHWLAVACLVASAFTVSATQAPGPGAFQERLAHFVIQGAALWLLVAGLSAVTSNGWPGFRAMIVALAALVVAGGVWALLPW